jgi:hypothetical protein
LEFTDLLRLIRRHPEAGSKEELICIEALRNDFESRTWIPPFNSPRWGKWSRRLYDWLGTTDCSGHTREKCLRNLISTYTVGDENRILLRLADWVPEVRAVAREWILEHFDDVSLETVLKNANLILYLSRKQKLVDDPALKKIEDVIRLKIQELDETRFFELEDNFRKYLYRIASVTDHRLRKWMLKEDDPAVKLLFLRHPDSFPLTQEEVELLSRDTSVPIKREYLEFRVRHGIQIEKEELIALALDKHGALRHLGRFFLKKLHEFDCYEMYRSLDDERIYYLAEYGRSQDIDIFIIGIQTGGKLTQTICLRALMAVDANQLKILDIRQLLQGSRHVRKMLYDNLPKVLNINDLIRYKQSIVQSKSSGVLVYLSMILNKSYWHFVNESIKEINSNPDKEVRDYVYNVVMAKTGQYERPSDELRRDILAELKPMHNQSDPKNKQLARLIEFTLRR